MEFGQCGFRTDHAVNLYTSPDLQQWTFIADILPVESRPEGIYFRPKVVYNVNTEEYVLWINYLAPAISPLVAYLDARNQILQAKAKAQKLNQSSLIAFYMVGYRSSHLQKMYHPKFDAFF